jgi:hypothetical protein
VSPRLTKPRSTEDGRESGEDLEFLVRELPPGMKKEAQYFRNALRSAGERYDRYVTNKSEWTNYRERRKRLDSITDFARKLTSGLCELDILTREDLASRVDPKEIEAIIGSLRLLEKVTAELSKGVQKNGKRRDLAWERWILELADIYKNAFGEPARVWASGVEPRKLRGKFYRLLELSRPTKFSMHDKLSLRQINRMLKRRYKQVPDRPQS